MGDELVQHLEIRVYAVLGFSSGGPNAMACAVAASATATRHLAACGLVSSDGPYRQLGIGILEAMYGKREPTLEAFTERATEAHANMKASYETMNKADRKEMALLDLGEATRQGLGRGPAQDGLLESGDWSFDPADINTDCVPVLLWHGTDDRDVPCCIGQWVAERIAGSQATFIPGENHTLIRRHWRSILEQLVSLGREQGALPSRSCS